mmetsp:Transcript_8967/g.28458  ORF Transcript_8967/g.28458 Transcript_8967/m.28458 type:complete len:256 (-) Transcript_8967:83-850(-)
MCRAAASLWRWAGSRVKGPAFQHRPEEHWDTAAFVDAVHVASHVLQAMQPMLHGIARLRHRMRGTTMHPGLEGATILANWNSSSGFLEGTEFAYRSVLCGLWRPGDEPLPAHLRESLGPEVRGWLRARRAAAASGEATHTTSIRSAAVRFERITGPPSLEHIRNMDMASLRSTGNERHSAFQHDMFRGSQLRLEVVAVAEAERAGCGAAPLLLRRADRMHLECTFNLREGLASPFRMVTLEELLAEESVDFDDAE